MMMMARPADMAGNDGDVGACDEHADPWLESPHGSVAGSGAFREDEKAMVVGCETVPEADQAVGV